MLMSWEQVLHLADLALYRAKAAAQRLVWLERAERGIRMPDLTAFLAAQTGSAVREHICRQPLVGGRATQSDATMYARSVNWSGRA